MWEELVRERGGITVSSVDDAAAADLGAAAFVAFEARDDELLPAVARLDPAQAVAFMVLSTGEAGGAGQALDALDDAGRDVYLLKAGRVGGTDPQTSLEIRRDQMEAILDGIVAASIEWERDPDFSYEVAAAVPGIEDRDRFALIPRFLYARTDRVYQYAARVPALRTARLRALRTIDGLDQRIVDAVRWTS